MAVEGTPGRGMADHQASPSISALRKLEACLQSDLRECRLSARARARIPCSAFQRLPIALRSRLLGYWPQLRKTTYIAGALAGVVLLALIALWWRLGNGPIELDLATPWLTAAIEENFGSNHQVQVGGTQLERDDDGRTALRLRDIVVRDRDGTVIASAPKAEVGCPARPADRAGAGGAARA